MKNHTATRRLVPIAEVFTALFARERDAGERAKKKLQFVN